MSLFVISVLILILFSEVSVNNYTFNETKANEALKPRDLLLMDV